MTAHWTRPTDGEGTWRPSAPHPSGLIDLAIATVICAALIAVTVGAVVLARPAMCAAWDQQISYCPGFHETTTTETR